MAPVPDATLEGDAVKAVIVQVGSGGVGGTGSEGPTGTAKVKVRLWVGGSMAGTGRLPGGVSFVQFCVTYTDIVSPPLIGSVVNGIPPELGPGNLRSLLVGYMIVFGELGSA